MLWLTLSLFTSAIISFLIIRYDHLHQHYTGDHDEEGPQKFHPHPVPRIGGIAIFCSLIITGLYFEFFTAFDFKQTYWFLLLASLPAFLGGLLEDLTKKVGAMHRLFLTSLAATIGFFLLDAAILRLDIPFIDNLLKQYWIISLIFTTFAVGGVANAFNIIDGYNGLSSMVSLLILAAIAYVAFLNQDSFLMHTSLVLCVAIAGFLIWNYPNGLILLGDNGAYLLGFMVAEVSVLLIQRNPDVSPWFPFLLVTYPVFETSFTMYRRKFIHKKPSMLPDALHLHSLIYRRMVRWLVGSTEAKHKLRRNAMTSPYLWTMTLTTVIPGLIFWNSTYLLLLFVFLFIIFYIWIYGAIVKFKVPKSLIIQSNK